MAIIQNGKIYCIAYAEIKKQSTGWLKGVKKLLASLREAGEEVPDYDVIWKEVSEELERRLAAGAVVDNTVTQTPPEKMREGR